MLWDNWAQHCAAKKKIKGWSYLGNFVKLSFLHAAILTPIFVGFWHCHPNISLHYRKWFYFINMTWLVWYHVQENTFQAILITDGTYSYTLFTYNCELTEWDNGVTIGYSAGGDPFDNNNPSSSEVACLNQPFSNYSNVIYLLSDASPEIPPPRMCSLQIGHSLYLPEFFPLLQRTLM